MEGFRISEGCIYGISGIKECKKWSKLLRFLQYGVKFLAYYIFCSAQLGTN